MKRSRLFLFALLIIATFLVLPDAICVGDEGVIFQSAKAWVNAGFNFKTLLADPSINHSYIAHHFLWFFMQAAFYGFLTIFKPIFPLLNNDLILGGVMTYLQVAMTFLAIAMTYFFIRKKKSTEFSILSTAFIWLGSYGIGLLTGGIIEPTLCVLIIAFMWMLSHTSQWSYKNIMIFALISFIITAAKQYGLIFTFVYFTSTFFLKGNVFQKKRFLMTYIAVLALFLVPWFWVRYTYFFSPHYYASQAMLDYRGLFMYAKRVFDVLFGFSYGLLWTAPFLILALASVSRSHLTETAPKIIAVACMLLLFCFFSTGVGEVAIAGNRYLFPFLLVFIPEVVCAMEKLFSRNRKFMLLLPFSIVFFLPTVQYRHDVILWKLQHETTLSLKGNHFFADFKPDFHPALFAWKVQMAKWFHQKEVFISVPGQEKIVLETNLIAPVSVGPHLLYSLKEAPNPSENYDTIFSRLPGYFVPFLESALALILFGWIFVLGRSFLATLKEMPAK